MIQALQRRETSCVSNGALRRAFWRSIARPQFFDSMERCMRAVADMPDARILLKSKDSSLVFFKFHGVPSCMVDVVRADCPDMPGLIHEIDRGTTAEELATELHREYGREVDDLLGRYLDYALFEEDIAISLRMASA